MTIDVIKQIGETLTKGLEQATKKHYEVDANQVLVQCIHTVQGMCAGALLQDKPNE